MDKEGNRSQILLKKAIMSLDQWLERNGWEGYDLCDVKAHPFFLSLNEIKNKKSFLNYFTYPFFFLESKQKPLLRKLLRIKKNIYPQALGLMTRAYLNIYRAIDNNPYFENAIRCLKWLEEHPSNGYSNMCWGQPYDWVSRVIIPKNTPRTTVTSQVASAFLDAYELTKKNHYLEIAKSACNFFIDDLNWDEDEEGNICFSYTTKDHFHIHNANMMAAATLIRTWYHCKKNEYKDMGLKSLNFSVKFQNKNGSWYYWAPPDKLRYVIDNIHTGFVLESLEIIRRYYNKNFKYNKVIDSGLQFYVDNLFEKETIPKALSGKLYPLDIQNCAQGIITFCELQQHYPQLEEKAIKIAIWTIDNMLDPEGHFYYQIYQNGQVDKTPYIRWGESWMLRALSYLVSPDAKIDKRQKIVKDDRILD